MRAGFLGVVLCSAALTLLVSAAGMPSSAQTTYTSAQNVQPVFEGWERNPDGTFNMVFGYMNRNYVEELEVPVGADNAFAPGPVDAGSPPISIPGGSRLCSKYRCQPTGVRRRIWSGP
jgi:hypothetical protein